MTINSDWVKILKRGTPGAFSARCPSKPRVVFIDGQIKLMCGSYVKTWAQFFTTQFVGTVESAFATGAEVVVLGFDDYAFVPSAKNMTQAKRSRAVPVLAFDEHDELPPSIPECWAECIRNRTFKAKVIAFVLRNMRRHYASEYLRTVVIDWTGPPEIIGRPIALPVLFGSGEALKRGECDIKAFAWLELGPTLLVSTDGDFVPLALAQIEKQAITHPVYIHRMLCRTEGPGKRRADGSQKREFEYVDMQKLLAFVGAEFHKVPQPARTFAAMVALTGCDFSMTLPGAGPSKLWQQRCWANSHDITEFAGLLAFVARMYSSVFAKHINTVGLGLDSPKLGDIVRAYDKLSASVKKSHGVAARTKTAFWGGARMQAHVRNSLWTLSYWTEVHAFPDPLAGEHGFEKKGKLVAFGGCS